MSHANIIVDDVGPVATVTVNRPGVLNALDAETLEALGAAFAALSSPSHVRAVVVTGAGDKAFVAGADIAAMANMGPQEAGAFSALGHRVFSAMEALPIPIIAAVNGFALGGGLELALACDFIYASSKAKLGMPESTLAVVPGFGGIQRLARRVGIARARELLYTGKSLTADEAARVGLVNAVFAPEALLAEARAAAELIAARGPLAIRALKNALRLGADAPLAAGLALEQELFASLFATSDQKEGMQAFLGKRPARFQGK